MEILWRILPIFLEILITNTQEFPLVVKNQHISQYSLNWGANSYGWLELMNHGSIQQDSASTSCGRMTAASIAGTASLSQDSGSLIQLGNFSELILDNGCALTTQSGSKIQYVQDSLNGKSHIYCKNASWTVGEQSSILLQSLTNLYLHAQTFSIESHVTISLQTASSFEILDDLVIKGIVTK